MAMPLPSLAVIWKRCCQRTKLNPSKRKALANNVTHSGRTAFNFNIMRGYFLKRSASVNCENFIDSDGKNFKQSPINFL
ncbi:hypothetical protein [Pseudomonas sp. efr-133-TYG-5]|uniref:hypothetical protein n=1 Tax=Pseudomonas sp. efr-133-TYG-5 TaxID=3040310 RepID=UPI002555060C|nr:hypothetical protein [Pseudomonas sp. efr-133-TYG-5]